MTATKDQAIQLALKGNWEQAREINQKILQENPDDIETLNRLAFAYTALGKNKDAGLTYEKVLKLDNQNPIALRNLKRLSGNKKTNSDDNQHIPLVISISDTMFIEEHGKTKVIELVNLAPSEIYGTLMIGEMLNLRIKRSKIFVLDGNEKFIGMLPDDIGKRLLKFLSGGNIYHACVKSVSKKGVTIFIKEMKKVTRFKNQPSFLWALEAKNQHNKSYRDSKEDSDE